MLVVGVAGAGCAAGGATEFVAGAFVVATVVLAVAPIAVTLWLLVAALAFAEDVCDALTLGGGAGVGFCDTEGKLRFALACSEAPLVPPEAAPCDGMFGVFCTLPLVGGCEICRPARGPPVPAAGVL